MTEPSPTPTPFALEYAIAMDYTFSSRVAIACVHIGREMYFVNANADPNDIQAQHRKSFAISLIGDRPENYRQYATLVITDPGTHAMNITGPDDPRLTDELIMDVLRATFQIITEM